MNAAQQEMGLYRRGGRPCASASCSWPPPASATSWDGSSFIPHLGQWPGSSLTTSGCIGQV
jgi:hypothetical protein